MNTLGAKALTIEDPGLCREVDRKFSGADTAETILKEVPRAALEYAAYIPVLRSW